jgi:hypothetical protein
MDKTQSMPVRTWPMACLRAHASSVCKLEGFGRDMSLESQYSGAGRRVAVPQTCSNGCHDYTSFALLSLEECSCWVCCWVPCLGLARGHAVIGNVDGGLLHAGSTRRVAEVVSDTRGAHGGVGSPQSNPYDLAYTAE